MRAYADSSFLLSLYIPDRNHAKALAALPKLTLPLSPLTPFHRLELKNGLARKVFTGQMTAVETAAVWSNIEADTRIFSGGQMIDWHLVMPTAERLSAMYTPGCGTRSLDVIHVAIALQGGAREFVSFDSKQRRLAALAGLVVLPVSV